MFTAHIEWKVSARIGGSIILPHYDTARDAALAAQDYMTAKKVKGTYTVTVTPERA